MSAHKYTIPGDLPLVDREAVAGLVCRGGWRWSDPLNPAFANQPLYGFTANDGK